MARPVDPDRHAARRLHIIDAAFTRLAVDGYAGATTAAICRTAGIGSGTFFHYFPTKNAVLLAILDFGTRETREWFASQEGRDDARQVVFDWVGRSADELDDSRAAGFIRAVSAVMTQPEVAAALHRDEVVQYENLMPWVERAQRDGQVRSDVSAAELTTWITLMLDGFASRIATINEFTASGQRNQLLDTTGRMLSAQQ